MTWWRRRVRADQAEARERAADQAEARARRAAEQTARLSRRPPTEPRVADYLTRVADTYGRRPS